MTSRQSTMMAKFPSAFIPFYFFVKKSTNIKKEYSVRQFCTSVSTSSCTRLEEHLRLVVHEAEDEIRPFSCTTGRYCIRKSNVWMHHHWWHYSDMKSSCLNTNWWEVKCNCNDAYVFLEKATTLKKATATQRATERDAGAAFPLTST